METDKKPNSQKIRTLYKESNFTYKELSEITGVKYQTIASWIMGRRNPPDYVYDIIETKILQAKKK